LHFDGASPCFRAFEAKNARSKELLSILDPEMAQSTIYGIERSVNDTESSIRRRFVPTLFQPVPEEAGEDFMVGGGLQFLRRGCIHAAEPITMLDWIF
jgi:hypothetical protein